MSADHHNERPRATRDTSPAIDPWGMGRTSAAEPDALLEGLNERQREAVEYRGDALLIVAGAGSGKTRVLTHRIAHLIAGREAWPSQILAITFTNKAAAEMRERVGQLLGAAAEGMWISTFHSACVRILRREAEAFGLSPTFTIYDSADTRALIKRILKDLGADTFGLTPGGVSARISKLKNELIDFDTFARDANLSDPKEEMFLAVFREYDRALRAASAFDFDDLIAQTVYLFRAFPRVAALYRRRFRHVLVDEYQDTNHAQYALIRELTRVTQAADVPPDTRIALRPDGSLAPASLTVVGDSDQSIYAFRGADIRNIAEFEHDFPGARVVLLEQNYRSTNTILKAANAVIGNNIARQAKNLWSELGDGEPITGFTGYSAHDEAQFIADEIEALHASGMHYSDMAVFYRTNAQTRAIEEIFMRSGVPYRIMGGTKFYERAEVKDALAYLIAVSNPDDPMAVRRILNTPKRGIGQVSETRIASFAERSGITFREAMRRVEEIDVTPRVRSGVRALVDLLDHVMERLLRPDPGTRMPVSKALEKLLTDTGYLTMLRESEDPQDQARAENLVELVGVTKEFAKNSPEGTIVEFLTEVALVAAADDIDDSVGAVQLMTLHTAKGLEYEAVFLAGLEEELLPHRMSLAEPGGPQEERRLFYVGITRARRRLFISLAMMRAQFGEVNVAMPSRFLDEIPTELISWRQSPQELAAGGGIAGAGAGHGVGFRAERGDEDANGRWPSRGGRGSFTRRVPGSRADALDPFGNETGGGDPFGAGPRGSDRAGAPGGVPAAGSAQGQRGGARAGGPAAKAGATTWTNGIVGTVRDNGDLALAPGDRIRHERLGPGTVKLITGEGAKRAAEIEFDETGARKKLIVKLAPIELLDADAA